MKVHIDRVLKAVLVVLLTWMGGITVASAQTTADNVYVVTETGDGARLKVVFHQYNGAQTVMYVRRADIGTYMEDVIYNPGAGAIPSNAFFRGWTTNSTYTAEDMAGAMTIDEVRADLTTRLNGSFHNEDEVHYYAVLVRHHTVTYLDEEQAVVASKEVPYPLGSSSSVSYTIDMNYTPLDDEHSFEGWEVQSGSGNISGYSAGTLYQLNDGFTFSGDVVFAANVSPGNWLVFDENGKGGTYNAPQFVKANRTTQEPRPSSEMVRLGYTFGGWYTDQACTAGNEFTFGGYLTERTTIYAKWIPSPTANYTVIIWKQNLDATGYDFEEAITLSGNTGSTINTVSSVGSGNSGYASINGTGYQYTGFHLKEFDQNVSIAPEGSSVLNVYYDRTEYTLTFQVPVYVPTSGTSGTQYGLVDGDYVELTRSNNSWRYTLYYRYTGDHYRYSWGRYYVINENQWPQYTNYGYYNGSYVELIQSGDYWYLPITYTYSGTRYVIEYQSVKTITALYQQPIGENFPIVGTNGVTYNNGERWMPQGSSTFSDVLVYIDIMPDENVTFRLNTSTNPLKTIYYYVEALESQTSDETYMEYNGMGFVLYHRTDARYGWFTASEDYLDLSGYNKGADAYPPYSDNGKTGDEVWGQ